MKIEIELEEVEYLRKELADAKGKIRGYEDYLKELDEKLLIDRAMRLGKDLAIKIVGKIFEKLGFGNDTAGCDFPYNNYDGTGKYWWHSDNVEVTVGATITDKMKKAFIRVGIIPVDYKGEDEIKLPD